MEIRDALMIRQSIRSYQMEQITEEELEYVLNAAYAAPNADSAYEDIQLSVIQSKEILSDIIEIYRKAMGDPCANPLYDAPTFVVVSTVVSENDPVGYANAGCIIENMALAATDLGLAHVYIYGMFDDLRLKGNHALDTYLNLHDGKTSISGIVLGYPKEKLTMRTETKGTIKTVYL